jgi:hypothetical protein
MPVQWTEARSIVSVRVELVKTAIKAIWVVDIARRVSYKVYGGT